MLNNYVNVKQSDQPIIATDRWALNDEGKLCKTYSFFRDGDRDKFVADIFHYEKLTSHNAEITVYCDDVKLKVFTKGIDVVTHSDKEYAAYADLCYREIVYNTQHIDANLEQDMKDALEEPRIRMGEEINPDDEEDYFDE